MNDNPAVLETSVADLLRKNPQAVNLFINHRTACVGCYMARFCTLKDVIEIYSLDADQVTRDVSKFDVQKSPL